MIVRRDGREQNGRVRHPLPHVRRENIHQVLPRRIVEPERSDECIAQHHERSAGTHERNQFPPAGHDDARGDGPDWCGDGRDGEAGSRFRRRV